MSTVTNVDGQLEVVTVIIFLFVCFVLRQDFSI